MPGRATKSSSISFGLGEYSNSVSTRCGDIILRSTGSNELLGVDSRPCITVVAIDRGVILHHDRRRVGNGILRFIEVIKRLKSDISLPQNIAFEPPGESLRGVVLDEYARRYGEDVVEFLESALLGLGHPQEDHDECHNIESGIKAESALVGTCQLYHPPRAIMGVCFINAKVDQTLSLPKRRR